MIGMPMPTHPSIFAIRRYQPGDHDDWVRCRVLSFLDTQYYDDVRGSRAALDDPSIALVATVCREGAETVVGILDVQIEGRAATIETIATCPDHQNSGVGAGLLQAALAELATLGIETLDAWTREDVAANRWYQRNGFAEQFRYLHIYLDEDDDPTGFVTPEGLSLPVACFVHGSIEDEELMRQRFRRVYACRQYLRPVTAAG